ncbi:hypothetical protein FWF89_01325 [Candidatus Saccharibacteria bacterium]|nr:hypothetical protein [Candidatus Saccharibacteria bacterium]
MKKKISLMLLALVSIIALGGVLQTASVLADEFDIDRIEEQYQQGYLLISPNRLRYKGLLEPGKSYTETFMAYNIGAEPISFNLTVEPFGVKGEDYEPIYSEATNRTKVTDWVSFPTGTEFTLAPRNERDERNNYIDRIEITVRIKVPSDAIGGGQYAAVMANIVSTNPGPSVGAKARIALLLYSTINGDVVYKGAIINQAISAFSFEPIIKTSSTVENSGNADFQATYRISVEPFFGGELAYENTEEKIIMPETKRIFEQNWDSAPALGIFNVTQEITYINEDGQEVTDTFKRLTIICPLWLILVVIAILVLLIIAIIIKRKRRKMKGSKKPSWEQG